MNVRVKAPKRAGYNYRPKAVKERTVLLNFPLLRMLRRSLLRNIRPVSSPLYPSASDISFYSHWHAAEGKDHNMLPASAIQMELKSELCWSEQRPQAGMSKRRAHPDTSNRAPEQPISQTST